jgi:hypothetical protein
MPHSSGAFDLSQFGITTNEAAGTGGELSQWYFENQQIMSLLNDNILF